MMTAHSTPYGIKLRAAAMEARALADVETNRLLFDMVALIDVGRYGQVRSAFDELRPVYQDRIGPPPWSREHDSSSTPDTSVAEPVEAPTWTTRSSLGS